MREILRFAALLLILGIMMIVAAALVSLLGYQTQGINDSYSAHRVGAANALTLLIGFGGAGLLYLFFFERKALPSFLIGMGASGSAYGWIAVFMAGLFAFLPWLGLDEETFTLPQSLESWEKLLEGQEARIEAIMIELIRYGEFPLLVVYMAIAPAIAEELFFRGALQRQLARLMPMSAAVWLTALIFSAIHFQVYGFFPRVILGAVMGYLTAWTGRLAPAIWAHFLNNFYATLVAYLGMHVFGHPEWIASDYRPPLWIGVAGAVVAGFSAYPLYKLLRRA